MALPNTPTGAIQNKVAVKLAALPAAGDVDSLSEIKTIFNAGDDAAGGLYGKGRLDNVTAFGPLSLRGNNATWLEFGNDTEASLPSPATPNEFPLTWVITEGDTLNGHLLEADVGDDIWAVLALSADGHWTDQLAADDVAYVVGGAISGVDVNFDTPRGCTLNIALARRPERVTDNADAADPKAPAA